MRKDISETAEPSVSRPSSVPAVGQVPAYDAGWNAQEIGLERETVRVLTPPSGRGWALLGWDTRAALDPRDSPSPASSEEGTDG
jgi:hypothetical protein